MSIISSSVRFIKKQTKLTIGIVIGLLAGGIGSVAVFAATPDSNGVIHACYSSGELGTGAVRVIDSTNQSCNENETAVSWNSAAPGQFLTNLAGADFTNANIAYRNFAGVDMHGGILDNTVLKGSNFTGTNFSGETISDNFDATSATFAGANFSNNTWNQVTITSGDFSNISIQNTVMNGQTTITNSNFSGVDFSTTSPYGLTFNTVNLSNAKFTDFSAFYLIVNFLNSNLSNTDFRNSILAGGQFSGSNMAGADFSNDAIDNVDFSQTDLSQATLTGAAWSNVTCPDGTNSDNNSSTCIGHLIP